MGTILTTAPDYYEYGATKGSGGHLTTAPDYYEYGATKASGGRLTAHCASVLWLPLGAARAW